MRADPHPLPNLPPIIDARADAREDATGVWAHVPPVAVPGVPELANGATFHYVRGSDRLVIIARAPLADGTFLLLARHGDGTLYVWEPKEDLWIPQADAPYPFPTR